MAFDFLKLRSLQARVTVLTLAMFVVGMWSLGYYASQLLRQDMTKLASDRQLATATILADEVGAQLQLRFDALDAVAKRITPAQLGGTKALQQLLVERPVFQLLFNGGTFVTNNAGATIGSYPPALQRLGNNYSDRDYIANSIAQGVPVLGKPVMGRAVKAPIVPMAVPIRNAQGKVSGALAGIINLDAPSFLSAITRRPYGTTGDYFIVSTQHRLTVMASDKSWVMQALPAPGVNPTIDKLMAGYEGSLILKNQLGVEVLNSGKRIAGTDWDLVVSLPTSEALAPLYAMQQRVFIAGVVLTLLAGGLTWWLLRRQLAPAFATMKAMSSVTGGEQLPQALPVVRNDEIGQLITGFNTLLETLRIQAMALKVSDQALQDVSQAVVITDCDQNIISSNDAHAAITGYSKQEIVGLNSRILQGPQTDPMAVDAIRLALQNDAPFSGEILNYRKNRTPFWNDLTISPMRDSDGQVTHYVGVMRDVTERKTTEGNVRQLAFFDTLTNLPNRRLLNDRLTQAMAVSKRSAFYGAVMFLDLDNFKQLNDTHGHAAGDLLLIEVANRLRQCVREVDTLARFGGDEFVVVLSELDSDLGESSTQAAAIAEKIRSAVSLPYHLRLKHAGELDILVEHSCTVSMGVAMFINQEASEEDLLKWADTAMYQAKNAGRNVVRFYSPGA
jgi:diguanylate cyclase (GGDEF)-like protein/PAS domain S-box-containing protein